MNPTQLFQKLSQYKETGKYPSRSFWPKEIILPTLVTSNASKMSKWTKEDGFEYETSVFDVDQEIIATPLFKGTKMNVRASHKVGVKYYSKDKKYGKKDIIIDNKLASSKDILISQFPRKPAVNFVFSIHSHPIHLNANGQETYSFFSEVDMNSLISNKNLMMGLACDTLWLACKTDKTINVIGENGREMLYQVSHEAFHGEKYLDDAIQREMANWGIVFYHGDFGGKLKRVN